MDKLDPSFPGSSSSSSSINSLPPFTFLSPRSKSLHLLVLPIEFPYRQVILLANSPNGLPAAAMVVTTT
jgi:hypothetical protein